jgi:hypothetical protein
MMISLDLPLLRYLDLPQDAPTVGPIKMKTCMFSDQKIVHSIKTIFNTIIFSTTLDVRVRGHNVRSSYIQRSLERLFVVCSLFTKAN